MYAAIPYWHNKHILTFPSIKHKRTNLKSFHLHHKDYKEEEEEEETSDPKHEHINKTWVPEHKRNKIQ